jgi:hypothetical protein
MHRLLKSFLFLTGIVCLCSLSTFFLVLTIEARKTLVQASDSLAKITKDVDDLKVMTNATLYQISDASHEVANTAREQKKYWNQTGQQTVLAMKQLNRVLVQVQSTTSGLDTDASRITDSTVQSMNQVQQTLVSTQAMLASSTVTIDSMNKLVSDPNIQDTLSHVNQTAANVQSTTARVDKEVENLMKPKSLIKSALGFLLDTASKVAVIFK